MSSRDLLKQSALFVQAHFPVNTASVLLSLLLLCLQEMNLKAEDIYMRTPEFLHAHGIELWTEKEVHEQLSSDLNRRLRSCHGEPGFGAATVLLKPKTCRK